MRKRIKGRDERVVIGRFPEVTIELARKHTRIIKGKVAAGMDPNAKKRAIRQELTFGELFNEYSQRRAGRGRARRSVRTNRSFTILPTSGPDEV